MSYSSRKNVGFGGNHNVGSCCKECRTQGAGKRNNLKTTATAITFLTATTNTTAATKAKTATTGHSNKKIS